MSPYFGKFDKQAVLSIHCSYFSANSIAFHLNSFSLVIVAGEAYNYANILCISYCLLLRCEIIS